jgi:O-antigen/teichoic acid export membrane protein
MWAFTRHLLLNNVILYALKNLDNLVVAKLAGTAALGLYAMSYNLVNTTVMFVIRPLSTCSCRRWRGWPRIASGSPGRRSRW